MLIKITSILCMQQNCSRATLWTALHFCGELQNKLLPSGLYVLIVLMMSLCTHCSYDVPAELPDVYKCQEFVEKACGCRIVHSSPYSSLSLFEPPYSIES